MKIRFYGKLGERIGPEVDIDPPPGADTVLDLRGALADLFPEAALDLTQRSRACVDDAFVLEDYPVGDAKLIEFLPPLSGG